MCPACVTTSALIIVGMTTTGGLAAFAATKLRAIKKSRTNEPKKEVES